MNTSITNSYDKNNQFNFHLFNTQYKCIENIRCIEHFVLVGFFFQFVNFFMLHFHLSGVHNMHSLDLTCKYTLKTFIKLNRHMFFNHASILISHTIYHHFTKYSMEGRFVQNYTQWKAECSRISWNNPRHISYVTHLKLLSRTKASFPFKKQGLLSFYMYKFNH